MKKSLKNSCLCFFFNTILCISCLQSQNFSTLLNPSNSFISQRIESSNSEGFIYFKNSSDLNEGELFTIYKSASGLFANDSMILIKSAEDEMGYTHSKYQQYFKNVKVEGGEIIEHAKKCQLIMLNGKIVEGIDISIDPIFSEQQSLDSALAFLSAEKYAWEDPDIEQDFKDDIGDTSATYFPKGDLLLSYLPGATIESSNYRLTWVFIPHAAKFSAWRNS